MSDVFASAADEARLNSLVATAKAKADAVIEQEKYARKVTEDAKQAARDAKAGAANAERESANPDKEGVAGNFATSRFNALSEIASAFDSVYRTNQGAFYTNADLAAGSAAETFAKTITGASDKTTKGGGTVSLFKTIIKSGTATSRILAALQGRVDYWRDVEASEIEGESAEERKARVSRAREFTAPAKCDGDKPKHKGRAAAEVYGFSIPARKGTNRTAQFAEACSLYAAASEDVRENFFHVRVLDAFLSNGGAADKREPTFVERLDSAISMLSGLQQDAIGSRSAVLFAMTIAELRRVQTAGAWDAGTVAGEVPREESAPIPQPQAPVSAPVVVPQAPVSAPVEATPAPVSAPETAPIPIESVPADDASNGISDVVSDLLAIDPASLARPDLAPDTVVAPPVAAAQSAPRRGRGRGSMAAAN